MPELLLFFDPLVGVVQEMDFVRMAHPKRFLVVNDADILPGLDLPHLIRRLAVRPSHADETGWRSKPNLVQLRPQ